ncbi:MAG TPA: PAS domain S-box protein [Oscillatoriales cyanobacterium M59_W2019_021]|nr:PAS domain S-box protein [Oscillatoriales cyanobacterium M4454_W2019_049]HIK49543.1 PAS domain S-box protein [Oscillatoriales cyanobacterium M59_W2019_021]
MKLLHEDDRPHSTQLDLSQSAFFKLSLDLLCLRNTDGYFQELNDRWTSTLGWTIEELKSRPWIEFVHPDDLAYTEEMEALCSDSNSDTVIEYKNRYRSKNGSYRWLSWRVSVYENGVSYGIVQDVTENTWRGSGSYRTGVREAVKLRDRALAASSVGIVIADAKLPDMPLIYVNPAFERITGYSASEVLGYNCRFLQGKKTNRTQVDILRQAIDSGKHCTVILLNYRKDKTPFWNELTISPIYDENNILTHFIGVQSDVSDRVLTEKKLRLEKAKSEGLLLNILPRSIATKLKQNPGSIAEYFEDVTILFADIVGFTPLASRLQPLELVKILNQIFSKFDRLADKHGVEKIKTIGDAYMVAGGLPVPQENHAEAIADMALEMQAEIAEFRQTTGEDLQIRIGINTGSAIAGVIGIKKFIYDLWGDAVNIASRMESSGIAGQIQVSQSTRDRLQDRYQLEERGEIYVKGKGEMKTYWLKGKKSDVKTGLKSKG